MNDKINDCPICNKDYHNIAMSYWVCNKHINWMVTICEICKKPCFSDCRSICPDCLEIGEDEYVLKLCQ